MSNKIVVKFGGSNLKDSLDYNRLASIVKSYNRHPEVEQVNYPGLSDNPNYATASKYLKKGFGGVLSFVIKGNKKRTAKFVESLKLVSHLANVGDVCTLIIQPAATTHQQLSAEEQIAAGVLPSLLRVSVGIDHIDDIIADFEQAFER